jgi:hypothetical protein
MRSLNTQLLQMLRRSQAKDKCSAVGLSRRPMLPRVRIRFTDGPLGCAVSPLNSPVRSKRLRNESEPLGRLHAGEIEVDSFFMPGQGFQNRRKMLNAAIFLSIARLLNPDGRVTEKKVPGRMQIARRWSGYTITERKRYR